MKGFKLEKEQRKPIPGDEGVIVYSSMRKAVVQVCGRHSDYSGTRLRQTPQAVGVATAGHR
ncbi:hypothetical protein ACVXHB_16630 [Escherichia coli]